MRRRHPEHIKLAIDAELLDGVLAALDDGHFGLEILFTDAGRQRRWRGHIFKLRGTLLCVCGKGGDQQGHSDEQGEWELAHRILLQLAGF